MENYTIVPDSYLMDVAEVYDNALVLLALLARGTPEDLDRAKILADSLVYCLNNDADFTDGRLYKSYYAADLLISNGLSGPLDKIRPFDTTVHIGNMAWAMISLISYYERSGIQKYLDAAEKIGKWIYQNTYDSECNGYTGGYDGSRAKINWKSTEHNIDVYVAFQKLYQHLGGDWQNRAQHAKRFVESMWNHCDGHFWTGTLDDGCTINSSNIPADVNTWGLMALGDTEAYHRGIDWVVDNCYTACDGFEGFDFNDDRDGIWWEGTAHTVIAFQMLSQCSLENQYLKQLRQTQESGLNTDGKWIIAACHDGVSTGFDWEYFARLHIGATAWYAFAELARNPYWQITSRPTELCDSLDNDCDGEIDEMCSPAPPRLGISTDQCSYITGETMETTLEIAAGSEPAIADLYIRLQFPNDNYRYYTLAGWSPTPKPVIRSWTVIDWGPSVFFNYTFKGTEAPGNYTWQAALTEPGTSNIIGEINSAPFSFTP